VRSIIEKSKEIGEQTRSPGSHPTSWNLLMLASVTVDDFHYSYRLDTFSSMITWSAMVEEDCLDGDPRSAAATVEVSVALSSSSRLEVCSTLEEWLIEWFLEWKEEGHN
jgi:hypothetical protein